MWHELAHMLAPDHGHDDKWREQMLRLGQPIEKRFERRI